MASKPTTKTKLKKGAAVTPIPKDKLTFGGRPVGAKNKVSEAFRLDIVNVLRTHGMDPANDMVELIVEAKNNYIETKRVNIEKGIMRGQTSALDSYGDKLIKFMEFVYPKLKQSELTGKDGKDFFESFNAMVKAVVKD